MKIGLYFGSFNPVHVGHLIIANHLLNIADLDKVWFIISPQNPFKQNQALLNEYHRLHLLRLATEDDTRITVLDIEHNLQKPSFTATTVVHIEEKCAGHDFKLIIVSGRFKHTEWWYTY